MPLIAQGGTATISAEVIDGAGQPQDPSTLELTLRDPSGSVVSGFPVTLASGDVIRDSQGYYHYAWAVPSDLATGTYLAYWAGVLSGGAISDMDPEEWIVTTVGSITSAVQYRNPGVYLTKDRLKALDLGMDLTSVSDAALKWALRQARAATDSYCNTPREPARHDFRGGAIVGEQRSWIDVTARRIYPFHYPVKSISRLVIDATNTLNISFDPADLYINKTDGYVEIINWAISKIGIWNTGGIPSFGLVQPTAHIDYKYGYDFSVVDEELTGLDDTGTKFLADNGFWDTSLSVVLKKDGVALASGEFTLDSESGIVTLVTPDADAVISASYSYHMPHEISEAQSIIAIDRLVDRGFVKFTGFEEIEIEELRMRRPRIDRMQKRTSKVPFDAQDLLDAFVFVTWR